MKRILILLLVLALVLPGAGAADYIKWVDFHVSYEALDQALSLDIRSQEEDMPVSWITLLALAACRTGGRVTGPSVERAYRDFLTGRSPQELLGELSKYYDYYLEAYTAALGGLVGNYAILMEENGEKVWKAQYGLKAFSPVAAGYGYSHCDDFGVGRSYGFARKHLGNDLMGALGTPIVAVETGRVEALGWNQYGGRRQPALLLLCPSAKGPPLRPGTTGGGPGSGGAGHRLHGQNRLFHQGKREQHPDGSPPLRPPAHF